MCDGCPNNPQSEAITLHCSQCKEILFVGDFFEITFKEDRLHLLCREGCKDRWEE
jgi:RNase P subunit RPR2